MDLETLDWHEPSARADGRPALDAARDHARRPRTTARPRARRSAAVRVAGILGDQQAALFGQTCFDAGRREEHLRHRLVPARQHRRGDRPHRDAAHDGRLQARRRHGHLRARGLDRGHRRADPVAARPARDHRQRARRSRSWRRPSTTTAASTSCPRSAACSRRTGATTRAARSSASPATPTRATSPARRSRRRRGRRARWSTPPTTPPTSRSTELRVDGGMTANELLMQFQADVLGVPVIRPEVTETTALGAAYAAGLAIGFWADQDELKERWAEDKRWEPQMDEDDAREAATRSGRRRSSGRSTGPRTTTRPRRGSPSPAAARPRRGWRGRSRRPR